MASGSTATARRLAAMRGETTRLTATEHVRVFLRALALVVALLAFVPLHYLYRLIRYGSPFPKWFLKTAGWICGARVTRVGTPLRRDVFFIANHTSWIDILVLAGASGTAFVAKQELSEVPIIGWLCGLNRTVFVKRENRMGVTEQINDLREALADNWSVTVFPEGTTTDNRSLLPFKTSMLSVLEPPPAGVLVQPVMLDYGAAGPEIGWVGNESGLNNARRLLARAGRFPVRIHFLTPFSPADHRGRKTIGARSRQAIEAALTEAVGPLRDFAHTVAPVRYEAPADAGAG